MKSTLLRLWYWRIPDNLDTRPWPGYYYTLRTKNEVSTSRNSEATARTDTQAVRAERRDLKHYHYSMSFSVTVTLLTVMCLSRHGLLLLHCRYDTACSSTRRRHSRHDDYTKRQYVSTERYRRRRPVCYTQQSHADSWAEQWLASVSQCGL